VEGALPGYSGSAGVLTDQERVTLRQMGVPLTGGSMEGIQAEFAEIYGVFCGATETIAVFYPGGQPSYICRRLTQMCAGEEQIQAELGAALADPQEAGAFLLKSGNQAAAAQLGVADWYDWTKERCSYDIGTVTEDAVRKLYNDRLNLSASQIDRQAECRMSYFLKYGLRAKERKEASVNPAEFGTYVHAVLEHTAREVMNRGGFHQVSLEQTMDIALAYSEEYVEQVFSQLDSKRLTYLFQRNRRELEMVVTELWRELKESEFVPMAFELAFGEHGSMDKIDISGHSIPAALRGFVDRVDVWEDNGRNYFRVVDYKTGRKDFDYCDVFNGVGLQLLLYLFALEQGGAHLLGDKPIAAGVQYFPARVPLMTSDGKLSDEEAEEARKKEWKRKGLLLHDEQVLSAMEPDETMQRMSCKRTKEGALIGDIATTEQLRMLRKYVFALLGSMVDEIASGNITPNPYTRGTSHDACRYCPYGSICHRDDVEDRRNYKAMTAQDFWQRVEKEVDRRG
jgi:ATP-dependent helicase/nuclease subunit B